MVVKRNFYNRYTPKVAQDLLGCFLMRQYRGKILRGMIVETEAYRGENDLACHASKGRTKRTEVLYGEPGHAYVYLIYGMYWMLNFVTEKEGFPSGVLIRGIEVVKREKVKSKNAIEKEFFSGPGKLTKHLHIDGSLHGWDLTKGEKLWVERSAQKEKHRIIKSSRVGIDYAKHCKHWKWNYKLS